MRHPVLSRIERQAAERPERLALADQSLMLSYGQLPALAAGLGAQVAQLGERERVGILAPTSAAAAVAVLACWHAGRTPVPLNFLLAPDELLRVLRNADIDTALTATMFTERAAGLGLATLPLDAQSLTPGAASPPAADGAQTAVILYTSGSSGEPKGVCLSFDNIVRNAEASIEHADMRPDHVFLGVLPQFHSFGFTTMTVVPLILGATVWYLPRFSPLLVAHTIAERGVTVFMATASLFSALAKLKSEEAAALGGLKLAVSGGEPLPIAVAEEFERRFGVPIMEGYGLTETSPVVCLNTPRRRRLGSVGTPLPGVEVFAVDANGAPAPPGCDGELLVGGHCVMQGYFRDPSATASALLNGALRTGDVGRVDAEGFVYITGRIKDMLIVGGENVFPREIELILAQHPAVAEAAVVGARDALRGEHPIGFVTLREGMSADGLELRQFCRDRLAPYKVPREVRIVSEFPRTPTGKVIKRGLLAAPPS